MAPDGAYPEGYGYWGYGTSFNVMFISAIEKLFGKDFGLNEMPGFLKTAGYLENMTGPPESHLIIPMRVQTAAYNRPCSGLHRN